MGKKQTKRTRKKIREMEILLGVRKAPRYKDEAISGTEAIRRGYVIHDDYYRTNKAKETNFSKGKDYGKRRK
jgi:hypothetical protein